jgi:hypothetical protein
MMVGVGAKVRFRVRVGKVDYMIGSVTGGRL